MHVDLCRLVTGIELPGSCLQPLIWLHHCFSWLTNNLAMHITALDMAADMANCTVGLSLSAQQLLQEFQALVLAGQPVVWSLASHNIQPTLIRTSGLHMLTPVAVDLENNCMNGATQEDFEPW